MNKFDNLTILSATPDFITLRVPRDALSISEDLAHISFPSAMLDNTNNLIAGSGLSDLAVHNAHKFLKDKSKDLGTLAESLSDDPNVMFRIRNIGRISVCEMLADLCVRGMLDTGHVKSRVLFKKDFERALEARVKR